MGQFLGGLIGDIIPLVLISYAIWYFLGKANFKDEEKQEKYKTFLNNWRWRKHMLVLSGLLMIYFLFNIFSYILSIN